MIVLEPDQLEDVRRRIQIWQSGATRGWLMTQATGYGKSYTALAALEWARRAAGKGVVLIVGEVSALRQWQTYCTEMGLFPNGLLVGEQPEMDRRLAHCPNMDNGWLITNYKKLEMYQQFQEVRWFAAVFDEAERYLTNPRSRRYQASLALDAYYRVTIGATPLLRHPDRLWPVLQMLEPGEYTGEFNATHLP